MSEPADSTFCRQQAEECRRLAQSLPDESAKQDFVAMAEAWLELAAKMDQTKLMVHKLDAIARQELDSSLDEQQIASQRS